MPLADGRAHRARRRHPRRAQPHRRGVRRTARGLRTRRRRQLGVGALREVAVDDLDEALWPLARRGAAPLHPARGHRERPRASDRGPAAAGRVARHRPAAHRVARVDARRLPRHDPGARRRGRRPGAAGALGRPDDRRRVRRLRDRAGARRPTVAEAPSAAVQHGFDEPRHMVRAAPPLHGAGRRGGAEDACEREPIATQVRARDAGSAARRARRSWRGSELVEHDLAEALDRRLRRPHRRRRSRRRPRRATPWRPRRTAPSRCACSTGGARSTRPGSSPGHGRLRLLRRPLRRRPAAGCASTSTTSPSSASATST